MLEVAGQYCLTEFRRWHPAPILLTKYLRASYNGGYQAPIGRRVLEPSEGAAPQILGALLDGVSGALKTFQSIELKNSCRMMDFAKWAEAGGRTLGLPPGTVEEAYRRSRLSANDDALDADPVAGAVIKFMSGKDEFVGTATELLTRRRRVRLAVAARPTVAKRPRG